MQGLSKKYKLLTLLLTLNATSKDKAVDLPGLTNLLNLNREELEGITQELIKDKLIISHNSSFYLTPEGIIAALSLFS